MTRLTNTALCLITLCAAVGCSAVVNSTLKMKDDAGIGTDSGVPDTGTGTACVTDPTLCAATQCSSAGTCAPDDPLANPATGCLRGDGVANDEELECEFPFAGDPDDLLVGVCVDGLCAGCGDGIHQDNFISPEDREECDDGNDIDRDGCDTDCEYSCHNDIECMPIGCDGTTICTHDMEENTRQCSTTGDTLPPTAPCVVPDVFNNGMCLYPGEDGLLCCSPDGSPANMPLCCGYFPGEEDYTCGPPPGAVP